MNRSAAKPSTSRSNNGMAGCYLQYWMIAPKADVENVAALLESRTLVLDNLNTHTRGASYEAFEPERAKRLRQRIEFQ